jgi:hypothetical protein
MAARASFVAGRREDGDTLLSELRKSAATRYASPWSLAAALVARGDYTDVFRLLEQAVDERSLLVVFINGMGMWDPIRSDPRFEAIVERIGLPQPTRQTE